MDYSEMSDFEINKAVGESTGEALNTEETLNLVIRNSTGRRFDPCNSWADAGPIIQKNSISLISDWNEEGVWGATFQPWIYSEHENPLRAAMECYLMMHDKGEE